MPLSSPLVLAVHSSKSHTFSKHATQSINLLAGLGVEGDAHCGTRVKHRYSARRDPTQPNLRQVHLIQNALYEELVREGFDVAPGMLGENVTTAGLDLLALPAGTQLHLGEHAMVELTGLRTPCVLIERFRPGMLTMMQPHDERGRRTPRAGVMSIVLRGGFLYPGDRIEIILPAQPHRVLKAI